MIIANAQAKKTEMRARCEKETFMSVAIVLFALCVYGLCTVYSQGKTAIYYLLISSYETVKCHW